MVKAPFEIQSVSELLQLSGNWSLKRLQTLKFPPRALGHSMTIREN